MNFTRMVSTVELLLGTDIIEIKRIRNAIENGHGNFLSRVFTPKEIEYCEGRGGSRYQSYAARFAGKESISKAFGTGIGEHASFNEIEILNDGSGRPTVKLYGKARMFYDSLGATGISISLSHCREYAVAYAAVTVEVK
jgi:holo-[acyl-carrier protein] synthase